MNSGTTALQEGERLRNPVVAEAYSDSADQGRFMLQVVGSMV